MNLHENICVFRFSETQNFDKHHAARTPSGDKVPMPNVVEFTDAVNLNRKIQPQINGFGAYNGDRRKSVSVERNSPRNYVIDTVSDDFFFCLETTAPRAGYFTPINSGYF